ncbi:hypothetical protein [Pandoraea terrigena]|uniref:Uncharacterized protein n=1 Tax=Pandoraea terrigena TaxID=2508292 RepID=A0A5E4Z1U7_9BURK|nr:hypothetical protein [Pandoraea terrigena]VVE54173.1 hypothetical protein PTE31013_04939 [Pandoraea terrigena]
MHELKTVTFDATNHRALIERAAEIIQAGADSLKETHCLNGDWRDSDLARRDYYDELAVVGKLRAMLAAAQSADHSGEATEKVDHVADSRNMVAAQSAGQEAVVYFVHDNEGGYNEFKSDAERDAAHKSAIEGYLDDGWSEEVDSVVSGIVTHKTVKCNVEPRPESCAEHPENDGENCDACEAWNEYPDHEFDYCCSYEPEALAAAPVSDGERNWPHAPETREQDIEKTWVDFWKPLVTNEDGSLNLDALKAELSDYATLMDYVPSVYMHATGGRISKQLTHPSAVCSVIDNYIQDLEQEWLAERAADAVQVGGLDDLEKGAIQDAIDSVLKTQPPGWPYVVGVLKRLCAALTSPAKVGGDDRQVFEAWVRTDALPFDSENGSDPCRRGQTGYAEDHVETAWVAWQAAMARARGWSEQHARDSAELRRLCAARDEARRTAEYWKAEHLAGNVEIERLKKLLEAKMGGDEREAFEKWKRTVPPCHAEELAFLRQGFSAGWKLGRATLAADGGNTIAQNKAAFLKSEGAVDAGVMLRAGDRIALVTHQGRVEWFDANEFGGIQLSADGREDKRDAEVARLIEALTFYAEGHHFMRANEDAWDTVSGEPQNFWCDEADTAMVEDGTVAKIAIAANQAGKGEE